MVNLMKHTYSFCPAEEFYKNMPIKIQRTSDFVMNIYLLFHLKRSVKMISFQRDTFTSLSLFHDRIYKFTDLLGYTNSLLHRNVELIFKIIVYTRIKK